MLGGRKISGLTRKVSALSIGIVASPRLVREALRAIFECDADIEVRSLLDLRDLDSRSDADAPDLWIVDFGPAIASSTFQSLLGRSKVLVLLEHRLVVDEVMAAGASGCVLKDQSAAELRKATRMVALGAVYRPPALDGERMPSPSSAELDVLSAREREVFLEIVRGRASREISRDLCVSWKTIETHRANIHKKLGTHSAADLVRIAVRNGIDLEPVASERRATRPPKSGSES